MDDKKIAERNNLTKRHFARFNERIQNKYAQMQRRIERSKSMESISSLGEEFVSAKSSSSEIVNGVFVDVKNCGKQKLKIEEVYRQPVLPQSCEDIPVYKSEITSTEPNDCCNVFLESNLNLDSVLEEYVVIGAKDDKFSTQISVKDKKAAEKKRKILLNEKKKDNQRQKSEKSDDDAVKTPDKFILSNKPVLDFLKKKNKIASVSLALIEATGPENETALDEKGRQFYCRIRLGHEKLKSKAVKPSGITVSWQELFNLSLFDDQFLEISMWAKEKDVFVGRTIVNLSNLDQDKTHRLKIPLEEGDTTIQIFMLITVSGGANNVNIHDPDKLQKEISDIMENLSWLLLHDDFTNVGWLSVKVHGAKGLNNNDCYAVLLLGNDRVETQTVNKTTNPGWMRVFNFAVNDITSILKIIVYDEKKMEVVGRLSIPLLRIQNGEKKWYALKDKECRIRAKGNNPRIMLEMTFVYNTVKASVRVINTKEKILLENDPDFSRLRLTNNIYRAKAVVDWLRGTVQVTRNIFGWKSWKVNLAALFAWLLFWWCYQSWMLPLLLLVPFIWYHPLNCWQPEVLKRLTYQADDDDDNKSIGSSSGTTLMQKLNSMSELVKTVQNLIGSSASLGESIKNLFNFTVPFLSIFAICAILFISFVLYLIPGRYIFMVWGTQKYFRKLLRPNRIPNNEILDLLSRVPDDETMRDFEELPLIEIIEDDDNFIPSTDDNVPRTSRKRPSNTSLIR